jgi:hypothetical protein
MASSFINLRQFVQVSTGYSNSNQPDGTIEEKIYPLGDPEEKLREITATGTSLHASHFPWIREAPHKAFPLLSISQSSHHYRPPNLHWLSCVSAFPALWTHECHTY